MSNDKRYLVWCCDNWTKYQDIKVGGKCKNKGGLGDRLRGLIAVKLWSRVLGLDFYFIWEGDNFEDLFNFPNYNQLNIDKNDIGVYSMSTELQQLITNEKPEDIFNNKINKVLTNSHSWRFILENPHIDKSQWNFDLDKEEFNNLYTKTLVPTIKMENIVSNIIKEHKYIIGVQLRTGDRNMNVGRGIRDNFNLNSDNRILNILNNIKDHLELSQIFEYSIFLTSDYPNIFSLGMKVWEAKKIIYYNKPICHVDKYKDLNSIDKTFVDNYILSQKTKIIYGSLSSGFTRVACLSSVHNNFYNILDFESDKERLQNIQKKPKKELIKWKRI